MCAQNHLGSFVSSLSPFPFPPLVLSSLSFSLLISSLLPLLFPPPFRSYLLPPSPLISSLLPLLSPPSFTHTQGE